MSAVALFIKLPKAALDGLRKAAVPQKRFFGAPRDNYHDYLRKHGERVVNYQWSGYVLSTLLPYLEEKHQIDLMKSECDDLADFLTKTRGATYFILTNELRIKYADRLQSDSYSEQELRDYFNKFNESDEPEMGVAMLDGIKAFQQALSRIDESSVVVFIVS
jgi:hypothetical protein